MATEYWRVFSSLKFRNSYVEHAARTFNWLAVNTRGHFQYVSYNCVTREMAVLVDKALIFRVLFRWRASSIAAVGPSGPDTVLHLRWPSTLESLFLKCFPLSRAVLSFRALLPNVFTNFRWISAASIRGTTKTEKELVNERWFWKLRDSLFELISFGPQSTGCDSQLLEN